MNHISDEGAYFWQHPHPVVKVGTDRRITQANTAAHQAFAGKTLVGSLCYDVLFGRKKVCSRCAFGEFKRTPYYAYGAPEVAMTARPAPEEHYVTCFAYGDGADGIGGCYKAFHDVPPALHRIRSLKVAANEIRNAETISDVLRCAREFVAMPPEGASYRVRQYSVNEPRSPTCLECCWHDSGNEEGRAYSESLLGTVLERKPTGEDFSFFAIENHCMVLVTANAGDVAFFQEHYQASEVSENIWAARSDIFKGLQLYYLTGLDAPARVFEDGAQHSWLDVPFGVPGNIAGKLSITPHHSLGQFSREEMEEISQFMAIVNSRIASLQSRDYEKREALLGAIHEVAQPAFMALTSIESLRRKDMADDDALAADPNSYFVKKNIETAVRLVAFLNDAPRVSRDKPSFSPKRVRMLGGVIAPIVNMFRHQEFGRALTRRKVKVVAKHLRELELVRTPNGTGRRHVSFSFGVPCEVVYDEMLDTVELFVDQYRPQEVFYNLLSNASQYRVPGDPLTVRILLRRATEFSEDERPLYAPFYVVDFEDLGLGIPRDEARRIFELGEQGSAAKHVATRPGTGRGLFVVREIMLSMGGDVYVHNYDDPTTFRLLFPAVCKNKDWPQRLHEIGSAMAAIRDHHGDQMPPWH